MTEWLMPPQDAKQMFNLFRVLGHLEAEVGARVSLRQLMAFIYFAMNDIAGEPKQLHQLRYRGENNRMENITQRSIGIFFEKKLDWLKAEPVDGRSNYIRLTENGFNTCKILALSLRG